MVKSGKLIGARIVKRRCKLIMKTTQREYLGPRGVEARHSESDGYFAAESWAS